MSTSLSPSGSHGTAPPSPSLTHASSNFDALDEFLDWSHFPDSTPSGSSLAQPQLSGTAAIDPALIDSSSAGVATSDWPQMNTRIVTDADDSNGLLKSAPSLLTYRKMLMLCAQPIRRELVSRVKVILPFRYRRPQLHGCLR